MHNHYIRKPEFSEMAQIHFPLVHCGTYKSFYLPQKLPGKNVLISLVWHNSNIKGSQCPSSSPASKGTEIILSHSPAVIFAAMTRQLFFFFFFLVLTFFFFYLLWFFFFLNEDWVFITIVITVASMPLLHAVNMYNSAQCLSLCDKYPNR